MRDDLDRQLADLGLDPKLYVGIPDDVLRRIVEDLYGPNFTVAMRLRYGGGGISQSGIPRSEVYGTQEWREANALPADARVGNGIQLVPTGQTQRFSTHAPQRTPTMPRTLSPLQRAMLRPGGLLDRESPRTTAAVRASAGMTTVPTSGTMTFSADHAPKPGSRTFSRLQRHMIRAGGLLDQVAPRTTQRLLIAAGR